MRRKFKGLDCILLIDDDQATNFFNQLLIESLNIDTHVESVSNGLDALNYLNSENQYKSKANMPQPGIVLLDLSMPSMDGWEFLRNYNEIANHRKEKMLLAILTCSLKPDDRKKAEENHDVVDFFYKPLREDFLEKIIVDNFKEISPSLI